MQALRVLPFADMRRTFLMPWFEMFFECIYDITVTGWFFFCGVMRNQNWNYPPGEWACRRALTGSDCTSCQKLIESLYVVLFTKEYLVSGVRTEGSLWAERSATFPCLWSIAECTKVGKQTANLCFFCYSNSGYSWSLLRRSPYYPRTCI